MSFSSIPFYQASLQEYDAFSSSSFWFPLSLSQQEQEQASSYKTQLHYFDCYDTEDDILFVDSLEDLPDIFSNYFDYQDPSDGDFCNQYRETCTDNFYDCDSNCHGSRSRSNKRHRINKSKMICISIIIGRKQQSYRIFQHDTVKNLKQMIRDRLGNGVTRHTYLTFEHHLLADEKQLCHYNLQHLSTIYLSGRLLGGMDGDDALASGTTGYGERMNRWKECNQRNNDDVMMNNNEDDEMEVEQATIALPLVVPR